MDKFLFDLKPNAIIKRSELHDKFGGSRQSGISPSSKSNNVFIFTNPEHGEEHGYYDSWREDGRVLHYSGEGQNGNQEMKRGNKAILQHKNDNRALRVFQNTEKAGYVRYVGEFQIDEKAPYSVKQEHSTNNGPQRNVFIFHLNQLK
ncbi:YDG/SRA domain-containing protein [Neisseria sp. 83E34]|uniref:YDG/SRA domain-containing protein n=1 Tax=Neisseria sp. 83E34 TaxID=1692264 RepID=UPI0006CEAA5B|nr:YDG/SRA domain-containing protein [Neisseria sp. 83E34]KPN71990.1 restriction endonuclease [Neisseria sp. 83E34]